MKRSLIAAAVLAVGTMVSGTALADFDGTLGSWEALPGKTWSDASGEHSFTLVSASLPGTTPVSISELPGSPERYDVNFTFANALTGVMGVTYTVSTSNPLHLWTNGALDSIVSSPLGISATKTINDSIVLTTSDAFVSTGLPGFTTFSVNDTFSFGSTGGVLQGAHNIFEVTPVPEPETYAMLLAGLGALGFVARRRKTTV